MGNLIVYRAEAYPFGFGILDGRIPRPDADLDPDEIGALAILTGLPPGWRLNSRDLQRRFVCGRDKVRGIFNRLAKNGYIIRQSSRDNGRFAGDHLLVLASPDDAAEAAWQSSHPAMLAMETNAESDVPGHRTLDWDRKACNITVYRAESHPYGFVKFDARITYPESSLGCWLVGALVILLSLPPGWTLNVTDLGRRFKCGPDKVRATLNRLAQAGYLIRCKNRDKGQFGADHFVVFETPEIAAEWLAQHPGAVPAPRHDDRLPATIPADWEELRGPVLSPEEAEVARASYNAAAKEAGLPLCPSIRGERLIRLSNLFADYGGHDTWQAAMDKLPASGWLTGRSRSDRAGWKADFDFLLRDAKFIKLAEGSYDDSNMPFDAIVRLPGDPLIAKAKAIPHAPSGRRYDGDRPVVR